MKLESNSKVGGVYDSFHPGLNIYCVIFLFEKRKIKVLLNKTVKNNHFHLLEGCKHLQENIHKSAYRIFNLVTDISDTNLFPFNINDETVNEKHNPVSDRIIPVSIGYYALINYNQLNNIKIDYEKMNWYDIHNLPSLKDGQIAIIRSAIHSLRLKLSISPLVYKLLPPRFAISELRLIYEILFGKKLDRRNFQRKMINTGFIIKLSEEKVDVGLRNAFLFTFDTKKCDKVINDNEVYSFYQS